jgi:hypothetical protein
VRSRLWLYPALLDVPGKNIGTRGALVEGFERRTDVVVPLLVTPFVEEKAIQPWTSGSRRRSLEESSTKAWIERQAIDRHKGEPRP